ncbi:MAG: hypothetical protein PHE61_01040 [Candidatus Omnitrophica bacterium]|nr:hypothetical protein [Candidatus Omnitrophota bacterium]
MDMFVYLDQNNVGDSESQPEQLRKKQDEFLDVYSLYLKTGSRWIKEEAILKAYELHMLDKRFSFEI